jgi:hypothetical protein
MLCYGSLLLRFRDMAGWLCAINRILNSEQMWSNCTLLQSVLSTASRCSYKLHICKSNLNGGVTLESCPGQFSRLKTVSCPASTGRLVGPRAGGHGGRNTKLCSGTKRQFCDSAYGQPLYGRPSYQRTMFYWKTAAHRSTTEQDGT